MLRALFNSNGSSFTAAIDHDLREIVGGHPARGSDSDQVAELRDHNEQVETELKWNTSMMTDVENKIIAVSPTFEKFTGYTASDCIGQRPSFLQGCDSSEGAISEFRALFLTRKSGTVTIINHRKSGEPFLNEVTMIPLFSSLNDFIGYTSKHRMT